VTESVTESVTSTVQRVAATDASTSTEIIVVGADQQTEPSRKLRKRNVSQKQQAKITGSWQIGEPLIELSSERIERAVDKNTRLFQTEFDEEQNEIVINEILVLVDTSEYVNLSNAGLAIEPIHQLRSMNKTLAKVITDQRPALDEFKSQLQKLAPSVEIDRNHLVFQPSTAADGDSSNRKPINQPGRLMPIDIAKSTSIKIGVIDTAVDSMHPVFSGKNLVTKDFVDGDFPRPLDHGTSVVSTILGESAEYHGLLPESAVLSASVFFEANGQRRISTTENISKALDWLLANDVYVINMSFTGPYSDVLEELISAASDRGVQFIAAAGNGGPLAPPAYPAAYKGAVAVTAVSTKKKIYRMANRGPHIMFSAPGVNIYHALPGGGFSQSSGTSMAAPFVSAVLASKYLSSDNLTDEFAELTNGAEDLGQKGRDPIYGYGLIQP